MPVPVITSSDALAELCTRMATADAVAVDFEFMRESTYYAKLCLVQLATDDEAAIVDPLAKGLDMAPLWQLLTEAEVLKVFHAGGQDIEIIYNCTGRTPHPVFDTQVAAMALGYGEQVGYQNLMERVVKAKIDKGARFTDWARRPLDQRQIDYAVGDVTHLIRAFPKLIEKLRKRDRGDWLDDEMARLADPATYAINPDEAWSWMRLPSRNLEVLGRLKALAAWREIEAQRQDLPRQRVIKDETLCDLAGHPPKTQSDLARARGLSERWGSNDIGNRLMTALSKAEPLDKDLLPDRDETVHLNKQSRLAADLLKLLLKIRCEEQDVAAKLVCRSEELERLAGGQRDGLGLLSGWRRELFGEEALAVVEGRVAFRIVDGQLKISAVVEEPAPDADHQAAA
jgi:ribonuclease D